MGDWTPGEGRHHSLAAVSAVPTPAPAIADADRQASRACPWSRVPSAEEATRYRPWSAGSSLRTRDGEVSRLRAACLPTTEADYRWWRERFTPDQITARESTPETEASSEHTSRQSVNSRSRLNTTNATTSKTFSSTMAAAAIKRYIHQSTHDTSSRLVRFPLCDVLPRTARLPAYQDSRSAGSRSARASVRAGSGRIAVVDLCVDDVSLAQVNKRPG